MIEGLYLHIPFCDHICTYCDFPKLFTKGQDHKRYIDALINELNHYYQMEQFKGIKTIYIGGGTPTALRVEQIAPLFEWLQQHIDFSKIEEFTIEANPENLTVEKIQYLIHNGITRISMGVQTFNEQLLAVIGRRHNPEQVKTAVKTLHDCGFYNINLDLIYAIPGQTLENLKHDLDCIEALGVEHISAYSLIVEEHTALYLDYMKDKLELIDNAVEAAMYEYVIKRLKALGYQHYEISNFAKNKPSLHNQIYWKNEEYYGLGLGSHGYVLGVRYHNTRSIHKYMDALLANTLPVVEQTELTREEKIEESMFLGLRLIDGVDLKALSQRFETDLMALYEKAYEPLLKQGQLQLLGSQLSLTPKGLLLANDVFEQFLLSI
ncbi:MAG TPA: oxygen-independent coproporphyrinogen III oxidase [Firmicutes bacterium]|nr:oxygen-independent coproporphyrinogen III oxidase [Bacillota bacterium]